MYQLILLIHVIIAVVLIVLVLIQHGKGADIGAAFGSGASGTVFGSAGSGSFLLKVTGGLGAAFFATSLTLGYLAATSARQAQRQARIPIPITQPAKKAPVKTKQVLPEKK